jgi:polyisoprenyl-teichoic acid--peptidoglycan teichoic acid transferase
MAPENTKLPAQRRTVDRLPFFLSAGFAILGIAMAGIAFFWAKNIFASWNLTAIDAPTQLPAAATQPVSLAPTSPAGGPTTPVQVSTAGPTPQPWDGKTRVTLLFMGLDYRACDAQENFADCDTGGASRTDSMMLVTVDPVSKTIGMLSIPRDLWVSIPGFDYGKINTAYFLAEVYKLPGGGPVLAMQTVQELLGVPIQYYAQVDFTSFVKLIDSMGGLDMYIHERIKIGVIGQHSQYLEPGVQTLTGAQVLGYARNRYTAGDDTDRSRRQQEVLMAIFEQVRQFNMLPTLVAKAPELYQEIQSGIHTNMTFQQAIQLAWLMEQIPEENIHKEVIGPPKDIQYAKSPDGLDIDIPVPDQIRLKRDEIFATGGPVGPAAANSSDANALITAENARVAIQNGSADATLADRTASYLRGKGVNVVSETPTGQASTQSTVIDYSGKPYTLKLLVDMLGIDNTRVLSRYDPNSTVDVEVILGSTFAKNNPLPLSK